MVDERVSGRPSNRHGVRAGVALVGFMGAGKSTVAELFRRSEQPGVNRPLRRDEEQFRQLYECRRPEYLKAAICVETQGKLIASVAQEIISELNLVPFSGACD